MSAPPRETARVPYAAAVDAALERYRREHDRYLRVADLVASRCRGLAGGAGVHPAVQWRVKSPQRVQAKLQRLRGDNR